jgi:hypothetical protein
MTTKQMRHQWLQGSDPKTNDTTAIARQHPAVGGSVFYVVCSEAVTQMTELVCSGVQESEELAGELSQRTAVQLLS